MSRAQLTSTVEQNSAGAASPFLAGKNKIINGDMNVWQRGTSFTSLTFPTYYADRWSGGTNASGATRTVSQQAFTAGTAPVAGYEGTYFLRVNTSVAGTGTTYDVIDQRIEDVRTFANQTVTVSFWAKAAASTALGNLQLTQSFGSGGSSDVNVTAALGTITTSWTRYSYTLVLPSISGKTIGAGNYLLLRLSLPISGTYTVDIWGAQLEAGPVATPFTTASGTLQGELALCQRYYIRKSAVGAYQSPMIGSTATTTAIQTFDFLPVPMRVVPTSVDFGGSWQLIGMSANISPTLTNGTAGINTFRSIPTVISLDITCSSTTSFVVGYLRASNDTTAYFGYSAEL
jgi:hypothetical protein